MQFKAADADDYISQIPEERQAAMKKLRTVIKKNLPKGFKEGVGYGMIFSALSYVAWFKKMPEIKFNFKFLFSSFLEKFIRGYISYFGCMFFLSILVLWIFNVQVALFLPSLILTGIEYVRQKKWKTKPAANPPLVAKQV